MNKKLLIGIILLILAVGGALAYWLYAQNLETAREQNQQSAAAEENVAAEPTPVAEEETDTATTGVAAADGAYEDFSKQAVANNEGRSILFFHAPWCPQCRALDSSVAANESSIPNGVTIFKTDYDSNQALRQKYGVTIQTTLVEVEGDKVVKKYVAYEEPTFANVESNFFKK